MTSYQKHLLLNFRRFKGIFQGEDFIFHFILKDDKHNCLVNKWPKKEKKKKVFFNCCCSWIQTTLHLPLVLSEFPPPKIQTLSSLFYPAGPVTAQIFPSPNAQYAPWPSSAPPSDRLVQKRLCSTCENTEH